MAVSLETITSVRQFNRFYTRLVGLLDQHILDSQFSLSQVRILYEISQAAECTAGKLIEMLQIDGGYLSRMLKAFEKEKLISRKKSTADGRAYILQLTPAGKKLLETLDQRSNLQIQQLLEPLQPEHRQTVVEAMRIIEYILSARCSPGLAAITFRHQFRPGDVGLLIHMHGKLYAQESGYNQEFEAYVCKTFYDFFQTYNPAKDRIFVATYQDQIVGSVGILGHSDELAQLRWLLVDPLYRGIGLGKKLVTDALDFCREKQYSKVFLLTTHQQTLAHQLYKKAGFQKTSQQQQQVWGHDLYEERYELDLLNDPVNRNNTTEKSMAGE